MESRIIAAVQRASNDNTSVPNGPTTTVTFDDDSTIQTGTSHKRKAQSGSVGRFLADQRNKQMNQS